MRSKHFGNILVGLSGALVLASLLSISLFGLQFGIEFTGGSLLEVEYERERPSPEAIRAQLSALAIGLDTVQEVGERGALLRMKDLSDQERLKVLGALGESVRQLTFESIGPVVGKELRMKAVFLLALALGLIVLYIMIAFRRVSYPMRSWQWSVGAFGALVHNVLIPLGALAVLGAFQGVQITIPIVVALLTIVGYSVNDTVVVFDRIRENLIKRKGLNFSDIIRQSIRQALSRSINTSFTTLFVVLAILFFGGETLRYFALVLAIGIGAGTWSSLVMAPFLLEKLAAYSPKS